VALCSFEGRPIEGFGRDDCVPFREDVLNNRVTWRSGGRTRGMDAAIAGSQGQALRLRFYLERAALYAYSMPLIPSCPSKEL